MNKSQSYLILSSTENVLTHQKTIFKHMKLNLKTGPISGHNQQIYKTRTLQYYNTARFETLEILKNLES